MKNINRRFFLKSLGISSFAFATLSSNILELDKTMKQPNVLLIFTDDQGSIDINTYGAKDLITPNLDKLAETGTRFNQCYAAAPVCSP
jgi:phosphoglycerol transferase MdoB-like AlkP superfamily enzyme